MPRPTGAQLRALAVLLTAIVAALLRFLPDDHAAVVVTPGPLPPSAQHAVDKANKAAAVAGYQQLLERHGEPRNLRGPDVTPVTLHHLGLAAATPAARSARATAASVRSTDHFATTLRMHSPNFSTRVGRIELITVHSTESPCTRGRTVDLAGVGGWLSRPSTKASIEIINNCDGKDLRLLPDAVKAWHVVAYNSAAWGIEQIGFASQTTWPQAQLLNTARWIARVHQANPWIPIAPAVVSGGRVIKPGVTRHMDLGIPGGGHHDPGEHYPFAKVLAMARAIDEPAKPISTHTQQVCRKYAWYGPPGPETAAKHGAQSRARHGERRRYLLRNHIACSQAGVATRR